MTLGIAIPMFNEAGAAEQVLHQTMYVLRKANIDFYIAVVNNGSSDGTGLIIDQMAQQFTEIIPIHLEKNQGYGGGILAGMRTLEKHNASVIGWMWGDGQISPEVLPKLYSACVQGSPVAKIVRNKRKDGFNRIIISKIYASYMKIMLSDIADINGCPKLFQQEKWKEIFAESTDWFLDAEVMVYAQHKKWKIHTESVTMEPRYHNKSKVDLHTLVEFTWNIAKWKLRRKGN